MLDAFNIRLGGGSGFGGDRTYAKTSVTRNGARQVNLPRAPETDETKVAKRIAKVFDVSGMNYYGVAAALWDVAPDGVKVHLYNMVDALLEVAADKHQNDLDYTVVECQIGEHSWKLRNFLKEYGFLTPDP